MENSFAPDLLADILIGIPGTLTVTFRMSCVLLAGDRPSPSGESLIACGDNSTRVRVTLKRADLFPVCPEIILSVLVSLYCFDTSYLRAFNMGFLVINAPRQPHGITG